MVSKEDGIQEASEEKRGNDEEGGDDTITQ